MWNWKGVYLYLYLCLYLYLWAIVVTHNVKHVGVELYLYLILYTEEETCRDVELERCTINFPGEPSSPLRLIGHWWAMYAHTRPLTLLWSSSHHHNYKRNHCHHHYPSKAMNAHTRPLTLLWASSYYHYHHTHCHHLHYHHHCYDLHKHIPGHQLFCNAIIIQPSLDLILEGVFTVLLYLLGDLIRNFGFRKPRQCQGVPETSGLPEIWG